MKILVLSNVLGSVDKIVDVLHDRHNIIAKEANMAESTMATTASEQMKEKAYDQVIVIARDPIQAGMLMNKKEGLDAAVCNSVEDVKLAKDNGANVIVIRNIHSESVPEIVAEAASISLRGFKMPQIKVPEVRIPQAAPRQPQQPDQRHGILGSRKARREPEEEESRPARTSHPGSLVDKIKDYLGIV